MRIERAWIDGFGRASGAELALGPGVNVISGLNGTGKSTLNAFVRAMLFGFVSNTYPALRGGRRGGHLDLTLADGRRLRLERHGERGGQGDLQLLQDGVIRIPGDPRERLAELLGGANREVFESVFAFGIDELSDAARLEGGEVGARIYGASLGASRAILELDQALRDEAAQLFRPRGQRQAINLTLAELTSIEAALAARDVRRDYTTLQDRASGLRAALADLDREIGEGTRDQDAADRLVRAWPAWTGLREAETELAQIGPAPAAQDLLLEEARLAEAVASAEARGHQAVEELERRRSALAELAEPRHDLLEARAAIEPLAASAAARETEDRILEAERERLRALTAQLQALVADLGPTWDEARLRSSGSFLARRDQLVARAHELLDGPSAAVTEARAGSAAAAREAALAAEQERTVREALEALPADPMWTAERLRAAVEAADQALLGWLSARAASAAAEAAVVAAAAQADTARRSARELRLAFLLAVVLTLAISAAVGLALGPLAGGLVLVAAAIAAAALMRAGPLGRAAGWPVRRPSADSPAPSRPPGAATADGEGAGGAAHAPAALAPAIAQATLDGARAALGLPPGSEPVPQDLRDRVGVLMQVERERAALERQRDAAAVGATLRHRAAQEAAARLAEAEEHAATAKSTWERTLAAEGLPPLDPDALGQLLERAEAARAILRERDTTAAAVQAGNAQQHDWEAGVRALLEPLGYAGPDPKPMVRLALADLQQALARDVGRAMAAQGLDAALREASVARELQNAANAEYRAFLDRHGLANRDELQARHQRATRRAVLEQARDASRATIAALAGEAESTATLEARLAAVDNPAAPARQRAELDQQLAELAERRDRLTTELGAVEQELRRIAEETETGELRQRREDALATLAEQADRYLVARLASELIAAARARFERLHRPAVVAAAERLFVEWTGGEYAGVVVPYGERVAGARRADDGSLVRPAGLSRGTREQLYLAFRFGLIEHYAEQAEPLPIVMDEVLVNFDPERAARVARSIQELGRRHQVLYLTCHQELPLAADRAIVLGPDLQPQPAGHPRRATTFGLT